MHKLGGCRNLNAKARQLLPPVPKATRATSQAAMTASQKILPQKPKASWRKGFKKVERKRKSNADVNSNVEKVDQSDKPAARGIVEGEDVDRNFSPTVVNTADNRTYDGPGDDGVSPEPRNRNTIDYAALLGCIFAVKVDSEQVLDYANVMRASKTMVCMAVC
jgi:hypothetical protein